jgi:hypothetical protein
MFCMMASGVQTDAQANIAVWQFTDTLTSFCPLLSAPLIATGTVHYEVEISDLAERIDAVGTVTLTSGGEARLHATAFILFAADGTLKRDRSHHQSRRRAD